MKDKTIKMIEENHRDEEKMSTSYKFSILYHPSVGSLEVKIYENRFEITDTEVIQSNDDNIIKRLRKNNAIRVFDEYYTDNFINN